LRVHPKTPPKRLDPTLYTSYFSYQREILGCEDIPLTEIANKVGTPVYVYSGASVLGAYRRFQRAFRDIRHSICYAVKANSNLALLRLLARAGSSFDVVSRGELYRLRQIKVPGSRIVFSGVGKTREEIREAIEARILLFNVESEAELDLLTSEAALANRKAFAALRVNPGVKAGGHAHISTGHHGHKFGIDWADARRIYLSRARSRWIAWRGISTHIGSQILGLDPFRRAVTRIASLVQSLSKVGIKLSFVDLGGGLGIRYVRENAPDIDEYGRVLVRQIRGLGCRLLLEPGRAIVGPAGVLVTRVLYIKRNRGKTFIIVDAAMNDFIRPALYDAVHPITHVVRRSSELIHVDIAGPVCETGDCFLHDWPIEMPETGDLLALWGAGAYGFAQASNYNSRRRPAEVLVHNKQFDIIRRRESLSELTRGELKGLRILD
jgi:diaminopimelate decarboxylase